MPYSFLQIVHGPKCYTTTVAWYSHVFAHRYAMIIFKKDKFYLRTKENEHYTVTARSIAYYYRYARKNRYLQRLVVSVHCSSLLLHHKGSAKFTLKAIFIFTYVDLHFICVIYIILELKI